MNVEELNIKVISYCDIPEEISNTCWYLNEASPDSYIAIDITSRDKQTQYADDFTLHNYIIDQNPELEGLRILIHIDY